ncbi:MAG: DUF5908 family protein [Bacteroidota bacterium]
MPIEIRELTIKTTLVDRPDPAPASAPPPFFTSVPPPVNEEKIIRACTERILQIIQDNQER